MATFTVKCLFSVWSLKWLLGNMAIKYSRWEEHLGMLAGSRGCAVVWIHTDCMCLRVQLKLLTWNTLGLCRAFFLKGKIGPRGHGPTFSSSEMRTNEDENLFSTPLLLKMQIPNFVFLVFNRLHHHLKFNVIQTLQFLQPPYANRTLNFNNQAWKSIYEHVLHVWVRQLKIRR